MICQKCRDAGDVNWAVVQSKFKEKLKEDMKSRAKALHALCKGKGCFCQHRTGKTNSL
jgi:hypothetical protein